MKRSINVTLERILTGKIYCLTDNANLKKSKGKQKKKPVNSSNPRVDHGYLACQHHRVIITGLAWIEDFVTTGIYCIVGKFGMHVLLKV